jgi:hypothetical protein
MDKEAMDVMLGALCLKYGAASTNREDVFTHRTYEMRLGKSDLADLTRALMLHRAEVTTKITPTEVSVIIKVKKSQPFGDAA